MRKTFALLIAALLSCGSAAEQSYLETIVVTTSRGDQPLQELAGNASVIDQEALKLVNHTHIQQSLARIPGANLARGNGQEYLPALRSPVLTGAGACGSILATQDGIPLRAAGFCNINELFDAHTEAAQRIEVIRGPGSALFGSNAMHGVINIISPAVSAEPEFSFSLEGGPHDYGRLQGSASGFVGQQGLRADITLDHDGGYRDDSGYDQQKAGFRHEYSGEQLQVYSTFDFTNLNQETAGYVTGYKAYKDRHLKDSNPNPEAYRDAKSARFASHIHYLLDDKTTLAITPYLRYTKMDFLQHFLPGKPLEQNGQKSAGLQSALHTKVSPNLKLIYGLDTEFTDAFLKQQQNLPTEGSAFLMATIPVGKHYDYQVDALMAAPFLQADWEITPNVLMTAGLRYEYMRYDYDNRMLDGRTDDKGAPCGFGGCRYSRPADRTDSFENLSPKLGLLYRYADNHQLYLNLAYGFRAPQATELYRLERDQSSAHLDSEELQSVELGFRGEFSQLRYELALFAMEKRHVIYRDVDFFNVPDGKSKHGGAELSLAYDFNAQWQLAVTGNFVRHRYANNWQLGGESLNGNDIDGAPRHFGSAQLTWRFRPDSIAELEWLHEGPYYTDPENQHRYDGHDILNLRIGWQLSEKWRLSTQITNLTDREYAERADYTSFSGDRYFPGEPRALYVGIETRW